MIRTKYMFFEAKDLDLKAKDMTSCPRGQGHGLEDSISGNALLQNAGPNI